MKKIIFMLILTIVNVYAKPCMTDIYFGNGVWNSEEQVIEGKDALRRLMFSISNSRLNRSLEGQEYEFKHAYNPSVSINDDLIETFYQLKESGQVSDGYFRWMFTLLNTDEQTEPYQKLQDIIRTHNDDAIYMFTKYENESFSKKHNVLLVAHSQGNLFGNKMYTLMSASQKSKFRMVSVATPANHVAGGGHYVTASGDYVIGPIPGSLAANVIGFGHTFIGTYLNISGGGVFLDGSNKSPGLISSYVKSAYDSFMQTTSCVECSYVRTKISDINKMTVECQVLGSYVTETIATFDAEMHDSIIQSNGNKSCAVPFDYPGGYYLSYTNVDGLYNWNTGHFRSKNDVLSSKGREETYLFVKSNKCITLSVSGDYYDLVESLFQE